MSWVIGDAQNPYIRHLTTYDGLPSNTVYQIYQDQEKFMWLTTDAGVVRYDGYNFINYRKKDGLSSNEIVKIREDSYGRIWLSNINGSLDFYYKGKIYNDKNCNYLKIMKSKDFFIDVYEDNSKTLFFYSRYGEVIVLDSNALVRKYNVGKLKEDSPVNWLHCLYMYIHHMNKVDSEGFVFWTSCGIFRLRNLIDSIEYIDSSIGVFGVFSDSNNTLLVNSTNFGLQNYNRKFEKVSIALPCDFQNIKTIIRDSDGYLWFSASDKGVYCMLDNKIVLHIPISGATGIFQDHEENIWISTLRDGIYIVNHDVLYHNHIYDQRFGTSGVYRLSESSDENGLWLTSGNNIFYYKNEELYDFDDVLKVKMLDLIYQFTPNTLFSGVKSNLFIFYSGVNMDHSHKKVRFKNKMVVPRAIKKLVRNVSNGEMCAFDQNNIYIYNWNNIDLSITQKYIGERINNIFYTAQGDLMINATKNYLHRNGRYNSVNQFSRLDGTIITDHQIIGHNSELINIDGEQLLLLDSIDYINLTKIISPSIIYLTLRKILFKGSRLILATSRNIYISQKVTDWGTIKILRMWPVSIEFEKINDIIILEDVLYIASNDGLTQIPFTTILGKTEFTPLILTRRILINDYKYSLDEAITLVGKNRINFDFGILCYSSKSIFYSYILEGYNSEWLEGQGAELNILYQNLPRGEYILKVKARKSNSDWSDPIEIPIIIKPTFYEYPVFWFLLSSALLIIIAVLYMKIKKIRMKKVQASHQMIVLEQKALLSMMNPHFIFNSLGSIQNYLMKSKTGESILYLTQFSRLIRQNLNAVKLTMINLDEEMERLNNYLELEQIRLEDKFQYHIEVDPVLEEDVYSIPSMMIQPFVENAIWHGITNISYKGVVYLKASRFSEKLISIVIEDNGQGMSKTEEMNTKSESHLNMGMNMTKKRLVLLSKKFQVRSRLVVSNSNADPNCPGTRITLYLPYVLGVMSNQNGDNQEYEDANDYQLKIKK